LSLKSWPTFSTGLVRGPGMGPRGQRLLSSPRSPPWSPIPSPGFEVPRPGFSTGRLPSPCPNQSQSWNAYPGPGTKVSHVSAVHLSAVSESCGGGGRRRRQSPSIGALAERALSPPPVVAAVGRPGTLQSERALPPIGGDARQDGT
jgi:hypothetical protein